MDLPNTQPPESRVRDSKWIDVHSMFPTIQGEGPFSGMAAFFVRLAGCNLQCPLCDTAYTDGRERVAVGDLAQHVASAPQRLVVITGGEPFRQDISLLVRTLVYAGKLVQIETNGALAPSNFGDLVGLVDDGRLSIVVSPKTGRVHPDIWALASAIKYVVSARDVCHEDGLPRTALGHPLGKYDRVARPPEFWTRPVYIHPADEQDPALNAANLAAAVSAVLQAPKENRRLGLQVHKYAELE